MADQVRFPNWQSRLLLSVSARKQPIHYAQVSRPVAAFLRWYERSVLRVDLRDIKVDRPIFLLGLPRSGTTMVQDLLCAHPGVAYFNNTMNRFPTTFCAMEHIRTLLRLDFEGDRFLNDSVVVSAGSPSDSVAVWGDWFKLDPYCLDYRPIGPADFSAADMCRIHEMVRRVIWCFGVPRRRFFSKLLAALPHLEAVQAVFPEARFIHIIRDPRMTANSMIKHCRAELDRQEKHGFFRRDPVRGKQFFVPYPRFPRVNEYVERYGLLDPRTTANIWNDAISYIDSVKHTLAHFQEVRYEDMLADHQGQIGRLLEFCELPPVDKDCGAFWKKVQGIGVLRHVNKYQHFAEIEGICRENMQRHGYARQSAETPVAGDSGP